MKIKVSKTVRYGNKTVYEGEELEINDKDREEFEKKELIKEVLEEPKEEEKPAQDADGENKGEPAEEPKTKTPKK